MSERIGQQLGNYILKSLLGQGGFADVYLGEHIYLETKAAIKVLQTRMTASELKEFIQEAKIIAALQHNHIVRVLDFGVDGNIPFLVMDYAPNGTLRHRHPKGTRLSIETILPYVKQAAIALQHAHDEKLIHRDIKPENLLLSRSNDILVSDFGLAVVARSTRSWEAQKIAGTALYMSPEHFKGKATPASDQYSLAVSVYEWLTGTPPFDEGDFMQLGYQHRFEPVPTFRERNVATSPTVEQVVLKALAKEPQQRHESILAFANALEQAKQPIRPIIVNPPPQPKPAKASPPIGTNLYTYRGHSNIIDAVAWSPDGMYIASGSDDGTVQIWEASTGREKFSYSTDVAFAVGWSPDGKRIASGGIDCQVHVWDMVNQRELVTYSGHFDWINALTWSPDGWYIASGGGSLFGKENKRDYTLQIWNTTSGSHVLTYRGHSREINAVQWSPDGKRIASGSEDKTVQIIDVITGKQVLKYQGHTSFVYGITWSSDSKYIASGSWDESVQIWDAATGKQILTCRDLSRNINAVSWSPDGKRIASASDDWTVQIWDAATGNRIFSYKGHTNRVRTLAWSPDGTYIASGSDDQTVQVWQAV